MHTHINTDTFLSSLSPQPVFILITFLHWQEGKAKETLLCNASLQHAWRSYSLPLLSSRLLNGTMCCSPFPFTNLLVPNVVLSIVQVGAEHELRLHLLFVFSRPSKYYHGNKDSTCHNVSSITKTHMWCYMLWYSSIVHVYSGITPF